MKDAGLTRRSVVRLGGLICAGVGVVGHALTWTVSLIPRVLYEPSPRRKLGRPERFPEGQTYLAEHRVYLVRKGDVYRALSAVCTHLGCTVGQQDEGYHCPCHGSLFAPDGANLSGPAPRPLPWHALTLGGDGSLVVDLASEVSHEAALEVARGEEPQ